MPGERTTEGWQLRLTPRGADRYVSAAFLAVWLCGWAAGESFALWMLVRGAIAFLTGTPPGPGRVLLQLGPVLMIGAFLLLWLLFWTVAGIAALSEFLRLLWGEDRLLISSGRLIVTWSRGPFRSTRDFERDAIRRVSLIGRDDRLALETSIARIELSHLGTRAERAEAAVELRAELALADGQPVDAMTLPKEWEEIITHEGERAVVANLTTRRLQVKVVSVISILLAILTFSVVRKSAHRSELMIPAFILLAFTAGIAVGAVWLARGRWEWRIGSGRLTLRKRYGSNVRDDFEARRLMLDHTTDSDGDPWFALYALAEAEQPPAPAPTAIQWRPTVPKNSRTVAKVMTDPSSVRDLAAWLCRETGLELEDRTTPRARAAELADLKAMLEKSGRLGRWAANAVDRLGEGREKLG